MKKVTYDHDHDHDRRHNHNRKLCANYVDPSAELFRNVHREEIVNSLMQYAAVKFNACKPDSEVIHNCLTYNNGEFLDLVNVSARLICERSVAQRIVQLSGAKFVQQDPALDNYTLTKFGNSLTFIKPLCWDLLASDAADKEAAAYCAWEAMMESLNDTYCVLVKHGLPASEVACILPDSLKVETVITMSLKEWRTFFELVITQDADAVIWNLVVPLLFDLQRLLPELFEDICDMKNEEIDKFGIVMYWIAVDRTCLVRVDS